MRTRQEHMQWCKTRALEYVNQGDLSQAVASMLSDLGKHEETSSLLEIGGPILMMSLHSGEARQVRDAINGFN